MKNNKNKDDFTAFQTKIFVRTVAMVLIAVFGIYFLYAFVLAGNFANWAVAIFQRLFQMDYDTALNLYQWTFRNHSGFIVICAIGGTFFIVFRLYLSWFTKYFAEINRGIDTLVNENAEDITLSPELAATEKKINSIRHTLMKQKMQAQAAEQRKNDLVMYLAHDLKTPLSSVIGYLMLLKEEQQISEELRQRYLAISLEKAERLEDLINEFFEIARFNISSVTLEYGRINLTRLLEQLVYEFQPMLLKKHLQCELKAEPELMLVCDANKLQRVFDNLLRNAVNYSCENTTVTVSAEKKEDNILLRFVNEGNTIPADKLERVFEQFYRLDTARSSESGGAGLGLAVAKEIIGLHHGTITAHSEDGITSFLVTLPL